MSSQHYQNCIDACIECATACTHCAVSCLEEKDVQYLTKCIRLNLETAVICRTTAAMLSLDTKYAKDICQVCATICNACAEICEQHASMGMEHCRLCAEACRACAEQTMKIANSSEPYNQPLNHATQPFVQHEECGVISRAASELISLESEYAKDISRLNTAVCEAAATEFDDHSKRAAEYSIKRAMIAQEANKNQESQEIAIPESDAEALVKNKNKHSSALLAASLWRSPVGHSLPHVNRDVRGTSNLTNTGPFVNYD